MTRGFTLIEMVIYIALLALVMGGTLAATFEMLAGQSKAGGRNATQEEGSFVLGKFAWAMGQITATSSPSIGTQHTNVLDITTASGRVQMCLAASTIWIRVGVAGSGSCDASSGYASTTTSNIKAGGLDFYYLPAVGGGPDGIEASTTIDGQAFRMTRYLRK